MAKKKALPRKPARTTKAMAALKEAAHKGESAQQQMERYTQYAFTVNTLVELARYTLADAFMQPDSHDMAQTLIDNGKVLRDGFARAANEIRATL